MVVSANTVNLPATVNISSSIKHVLSSLDLDSYKATDHVSWAVWNIIHFLFLISYNESSIFHLVMRIQQKCFLVSIDITVVSFMVNYSNFFLF